MHAGFEPSFPEGERARWCLRGARRTSRWCLGPEGRRGCCLGLSKETANPPEVAEKLTLLPTSSVGSAWVHQVRATRAGTWWRWFAAAHPALSTGPGTQWASPKISVCSNTASSTTATGSWSFSPFKPQPKFAFLYRGLQLGPRSPA